MKVGSIVLLKQGLKLIRCIVVDIDATFITLRMQYKQNEGTTIKVDINSEDIIKDNGLNIDGFDYNGNDIARM